MNETTNERTKRTYSSVVTPSPPAHHNPNSAAPDDRATSRQRACARLPSVGNQASSSSSLSTHSSSPSSSCSSSSSSSSSGFVLPPLPLQQRHSSSSLHTTPGRTSSPWLVACWLTVAGQGGTRRTFHLGAPQRAPLTTYWRLAVTSSPIVIIHRHRRDLTKR